MKRLGYMPDITIYDVLIGALCKNKEIEKALILYTHKELGILPDAIIVSKLLSSVSNAREMIWLLEDRWKTLAKEERSSLYYSVLTGFVNDGFIDKAYQLLKVSMAAGIDIDIHADKIFLVTENIVPSCFRTAIDGLSKSDKLDMDLDMFREMCASGHQPWIKYYTLLVKKLCEQGKAVEARNFLADMTEERFLPDMIAYSAVKPVIDGFIDINELNQSLELFEEICE